MHLSLSYDSSLDALPTDERLARIDKEHPDNGLINTYFDFGRYLLISSSRGDCLPANLQGIWNDSLSAPWGSKFTININTEMNYWPALSCRLADCEKPLFTHMLRMLENGKQTAKEMYDCRGLSPTTTPIYGAIQHRRTSTFLLLTGLWAVHGLLPISGTITVTQKTLIFSKKCTHFYENVLPFLWIFSSKLMANW